MAESAKFLGQGLPLEELLRNPKATPAAYARLSREIDSQSIPGAIPIQASFLSSFNLELTRQYLVVESARAGILLKPWFGPFGQLEQQCFEPESPFYRSEPEIAVLGLRLEDFVPELIYRFLSLTDDAITRCMDRVLERISDLAGAIRRHSPAQILVWNFVIPRFLAAGIADPGLVRGQGSVIREVNEALVRVAGQLSDVFVFDAAKMAEEVGICIWHDDRLYCLGRIPFGIEAQFHLSRGLARWFRLLTVTPRKCLVVDLDNTLWGGVVGEDGIGGIQLGEDFPGNVFKEFHRYLLNLRDRGVLLAVASKNNKEDALQVLGEHPDSLLRPDHFAALEIHWGDKATSLRSIAEHLNIGVDSLAFFDDNPVERQWVRSSLAEVLVIDVPNEPIAFRKAIEECGAFDRVTISKEDHGRAEMYRQESHRRKHSRSSGSIEAFLESLEMVVTVGTIGEETMSRCVQLLGKTNQFTLTTRHHSAAALEKMLDGGAVGLWSRVSDRFGDQGLVGVAIAFPEKGSECWRIDTFLLSCRVLQRRVETVLLACLLKEIRKLGGSHVVGEFLPTPKNQPAEDFYQRHGFDALEGQPNTWHLAIDSCNVTVPNFITLQLESIE